MAEIRITGAAGLPIAGGSNDALRPSFSQRSQSQAYAQPACLDVECAPADRFVIALVGLAFEARIASGPGVVVICRNTESEVAASLNHAIKRGCRSIISFGVAGGLAPHLRPGNWVVASSIIDAQQTLSDRSVFGRKRSCEMIPGAEHKPITGVDYAVADPDAKRRMHVETGAATVDMESHLVARLASAHGLELRSGQRRHRSRASRRAGSGAGRYAPGRRHQHNRSHARTDRRALAIVWPASPCL